MKYSFAAILASFGMILVAASPAWACGGMMPKRPKMSLVNHRPVSITPMVSDLRYGSSDVVTPQVLTDTAYSAVNLLHGCYSELLTRYPNASGELDLLYLINREGVVSKTKLAKVARTLNDPLFRSCVSQVPYNMLFPESNTRKSVVGATRYCFHPIQFPQKIATGGKM